MPNPAYVNLALGTGGSGTSGDPYGDLNDSITNGAGTGQTHYVRGTGTVQVTLTKGGSNASPQIFIATDASWDYLKGGAVIDATAVTNAVSLGSYTNNIFRGFRFINAVGVGVSGTSSAARTVFFECDIDSNGTSGSDVRASTVIFVSCRIRNNGEDGVLMSSNQMRIFSSIVSGNGRHGAFGTGSTGVVANSFFHDNTTNGIFDTSAFGLNVLNCSFYSGSGNAIDVDDRCYIENCIFEDYDTAPAINSSTSSLKTYLTRNAFFSNGAGDLNNSDYFYQIVDNITLSNSAFIDAPGGDFQISVGNTEVSDLEIVYDASNSSFEYLGALIPESPSAVAPTFAGVTNAQPDSKGFIHIKWTAGTGVDKYRIFISTSALTYADDEIWAEVDDTRTGAIISSEADNTPLINNTTYNIGVRAYKYGAVANDSNTEVLAIAPKGTDGTFIVRQVAGI